MNNYFTISFVLLAITISLGLIPGALLIALPILLVLIIFAALFLLLGILNKFHIFENSRTIHPSILIILGIIVLIFAYFYYTEFACYKLNSSGCVMQADHFLFFLIGGISLLSGIVGWVRK